MAKRKQQSGGDIPEWVVTYGDMMSLLLCFFILLAAFSEMKQPHEFQKVLEKIKEALGSVGGMGKADVLGSPANSATTLLEEIRNRGGDGQFMAQNNQSNVSGMHPDVSIVQDGNHHAIGGSFAFPAGKTTLSVDLEQKLRKEVVDLIKDRRNIVRIVGHSYGFQDQTAGDHLHVGFERAMAVYSYLVDECGIDPKVLRVVSAGDSEPMTGAGGDTAQNRRVQIYMTDQTIDQVHPDPDGTGRDRE
ncbi:MAG: OmpA family protein [Phycisphaeraceae bacterium]|nr:MAG: OmpA family protein [Phycisphaeraceae bacterium]